MGFTTDLNEFFVYDNLYNPFRNLFFISEALTIRSQLATFYIIERLSKQRESSEKALFCQKTCSLVY